MDKSRFKTARPVARLREGRTDWYRIENRAASVAKVYIMDEIGYVGVSAQDFVADLEKITAAEIELHLNTPGGDVFDGVAIFNAIRNHPAHVTTIVDGIAASAGSFIAQAGDHRVMRPHSQFMIHDAWGMAIGNSADMRDLADNLERQTVNIAGIYASRSGTDAQRWLDAMAKETWYLDHEAVEAGLADEVSGSEKANASSNSFDLSIFSYAGRDQAPPPVMSVESEPEDPFQGIDWAQFANALKGALE